MKFLLLKLNIKIVASFYILQAINREWGHFSKDFKQMFLHAVELLLLVRKRSALPADTGFSLSWPFFIPAKQFADSLSGEVGGGGRKGW